MCIKKGKSNINISSVCHDTKILKCFVGCIFSCSSVVSLSGGMEGVRLELDRFRFALAEYHRVDVDSRTCFSGRLWWRKHVRPHENGILPGASVAGISCGESSCFMGNSIYKVNFNPLPPEQTDVIVDCRPKDIFESDDLYEEDEMRRDVNRLFQCKTY